MLYINLKILLGCLYCQVGQVVVSRVMNNSFGLINLLKIFWYDKIKQITFQLDYIVMSMRSRNLSRKREISVYWSRFLEIYIFNSHLRKAIS